MKIKHAIILLALGFALDFIGALLKVMHWGLANLLLIAGLAFKIIGAALLVYKLVTNPKFRDFMNS